MIILDYGPVLGVGMLEKLYKLSQNLLKIKRLGYRRYLIRREEFTHNLTVLIGARGIGKTTTLVQHLLDQVGGDRFDKRILYIQADHFLMGSLSLYEIAEHFQLHGGKWIAFDEIHKYADWSKELKSICDTFPDLFVIASGSSALEIHKGSHDLSRRAIVYNMQGLSFREYLELEYELELPTFSLKEILRNHEKIANEIIELLKEKKVLPAFLDYLKTGYFPYFRGLPSKSHYKITLEQNVHATIDSDLTAIYPELTGRSLAKIKQLLIFIAGAVPFVPNWAKMLIALEIGDVRTLKTYVKYLEDAQLIRTLHKSTNKFSRLEVCEKITLDNPNQCFALASEKPNMGTIREIFFLCMLSQSHLVAAPKNGDFVVDGKILFEVGGKGKSFDQVKSEKNAFIASDDIEQGFGNRVPLWLFGFLY